jgi:hypothetical protein
MKRHTLPLAVTAVLTAVLLAGCGDDEPTETGTDPATTAASEDASPTEESSPTEEATTTAPAEPTHDYPREQKLITITAPEEGATVSGSFTASGKANSFEATVGWRILDSTGKEVLTGFATAEGWMDKLYPWQTKVDVSSLPPGAYVFVAATDDPSGGAEGHGPQEVGTGIVVE